MPRGVTSLMAPHGLPVVGYPATGAPGAKGVCHGIVAYPLNTPLLLALQNLCSTNQLAYNVQETIRSASSHNISVRFLWVPGHSNIFGNLQADELARTGRTLKFCPTSCNSGGSNQIVHRCSAFSRPIFVGIWKQRSPYIQRKTNSQRMV